MNASKQNISILAAVKWFYNAVVNRMLSGVFIGSLIAIVAGITVLGLAAVAEERPLYSGSHSSTETSIQSSQTGSIFYDSQSGKWVIEGHKSTIVIIGIIFLAIGIFTLAGYYMFKFLHGVMLNFNIDKVASDLNITQIKPRSKAEVDEYLSSKDIFKK